MDILNNQCRLQKYQYPKLNDWKTEWLLYKPKTKEKSL